MRRYFFAILSRKNIFRRKDILKYLLGNYHFKSDNIFLKYIIANRGENIFFLRQDICQQKYLFIFARRYFKNILSLRLFEKIYFDIAMKFSGILGRGRPGRGPRRGPMTLDPRIKPSFLAKSEIAYLFLRLRKLLSTNFLLSHALTQNPQTTITLVNFYPGIPTHIGLENRSI